MFVCRVNLCFLLIFLHLLLFFRMRKRSHRKTLRGQSSSYYLWQNRRYNIFQMQWLWKLGNHLFSQLWLSSKTLFLILQKKNHRNSFQLFLDLLVRPAYRHMNTHLFITVWYTLYLCNAWINHIFAVNWYKDEKQFDYGKNGFISQYTVCAYIHEHLCCRYNNILYHPRVTFMLVSSNVLLDTLRLRHCYFYLQLEMRINLNMWECV